MMLEKIQQSMQNPLMKALMAVIIVFFIGAGYFGANMFGGDPNQIAEVEGVSISSQNVQRRVDIMRQRMGDKFDQRYPTEASQQQLRQSISQQLVNEEIVRAGIAKSGFAVSDEQVKEWMRTFEPFQIAGEYSPQATTTFLTNNGWTESRLKEYAKDQITRDQLQNAMNGSSFALDYQVEILYHLQEQTRDVRVLRVPLAKFSQDLTFEDEAINDYYQKNQQRFLQPEKINLKYVRLSAEQLIESAKAGISDEQIQAYYKQQKASYEEPSEIQVAHILIDHSVDNAEAKAQDLLSRIQSGEDFATLAKEHSSDTFSAENGGQLDWVDAVEQSDAGSGTGWAPEFEQAALALESTGDVTQVVETQYGFHIIKLLERREGEVTPLEVVRENIVAKLAQEEADKTFYAKESKLNETLFEYGDDIAKFAEQADLEVQETGLFGKQAASGMTANPVFQEQAFSAQVINSEEVSDKIELADKDLVYVTVKEYKPEMTKPLEEVKQQIIAALTKEKAANETEAFANKVLEALKNGESTEELATSKELTWQENTALKRRDSGMKYDLVSAVYQLPAPEGDDAQYKLKSLFNGDYAVIEFRGVSYPDSTTMDEATRTQLQQNAKSINAQADTASLIEHFKKRVTVNK